MTFQGTEEERRWIILSAKETLEEMIRLSETLLADISFLTLEDPSLFTDDTVTMAARAMQDAATAAREALYGKEQ